MIPIGFFPPERDAAGRWHVGARFYVMDEPVEIHAVAPHALIAKAWVQAQAALSRRLGAALAPPPPAYRPALSAPSGPYLGPMAGPFDLMDEAAMLDHESLDDFSDTWGDDLIVVGDDWLGVYSDGYGDDWLGDGGLGGDVAGWGDADELASHLDTLARRRRGHRPAAFTF